MINRSFKFSFLLVVLFLTGVSVFAQVNDAQLWVSIAGEKHLNYDLLIVVNPEIRMGENIGDVSRFSIDAGIEYRINKHFKGGMYYKFLTNRLLDNTYEIRNRFYLDLSGKVKHGKFVFGFRTRYQNQYQDGGGGMEWSVPKSYLRNKFSVKYDFPKRWSPSISYEVWTNLFDQINDNFRLVVSFDYELNKKSSITAGYGFSREINLANPLTIYLGLLTLNYKF